MKAIILAAGEGSRLRPHTLDRPKCLVEIGGKTLLDRQLEVLSSAEIHEIVIVRGYCGDAFGQRQARFYANSAYQSTNMLWSLFQARAEFGSEALVCYGDIVYSRQALMALLASKADIAVAVDLDWKEYWSARFADPLSDAETLKIGPDGNLCEIGQKPRSFSEIEGQYIGLLKFSPAGFQQLERVFDADSIQGKSRERAYMTDGLQALLAMGQKIAPAYIHGGWVEVDHVSDLELPETLRRVREIESGH